ncbi:MULTISPECIES: hypothetical protein [Cytobacillus]|uniref:hypothetical protein n=1 Tax=Cytobacillus TaxID=2675230 RepID=UPI00203AC6D2|nr:hypothetical protein [Cytobacillus firmus]MCM3706802.1 hypothetical protein [Cytobacillus firmus]
MLSKKKFAIWFVSLTAALTLTACGGNNGDTGQNGTSKDESTTNKESNGHSEGTADRVSQKVFSKNSLHFKSITSII